MSISIEIQKKPEMEKEIKINGTSDVVNLKEIEEIRNAVQEYLFFIGLDRSNNLKSLKLMGMGSANIININRKDIIRTALSTFSDRVILVHNHPSNSIKPSVEDKKMTNIMNKLLKVFGIEFLDHIIVTEKEFVSMQKINAINPNYKDENKDMDIIDNTLLIEENKRLKQELSDIKSKQKELQTETEEIERLEET